MNHKELNNYIFHYLKKNKTQTAIMLNGEWGSGKSFYLKNDLVPFFEKENATCVIVSLYGLDSISEISKSIYIELKSRSLDLGMKDDEDALIAKSVLKYVSDVGLGDLTTTSDDLYEIYRTVDFRDKLLIFEDVERCNIGITEILGFINGLVERDGVKVLLVANEKMLLKKSYGKILPNDNASATIDSNFEGQEEFSDSIKEYLRIKEKTISDTVQFPGDCREAIAEVIKDFDNKKLNTLLDEDAVNELTKMVNGVCEKNIRTFIFAMQKTVDLIDSIKNSEVTDDFYLCLLKGILYFSNKVKKGKFPKWEGSEYLSTQLGSNDYPLFRFAYDYIRWQVIEEELIKVTYYNYKKYRFFEENAAYCDPDLKVLENFYKETEESVLTALKNVEFKLLTPEIIGIHAYCKLAYYLIYVGKVVGFDYRNSCEQMIRNIKELGGKANIDTELFFEDDIVIEDSDIKEKYESFINKVKEVNAFDAAITSFQYMPDSLHGYYLEISNHPEKYALGHRFISKFELTKVVEMLLDCSADQINDFRGILLAVYQYATKLDFDEKDLEFMKSLLEMIEKQMLGQNFWDKIQKLQIQNLEMNLKTFIEQMS